MSVDISDPQIGIVRNKIRDQNDPTTWILLHYSTSSTSPNTISSSSQNITLLASGKEPVLPRWKEHLSDTNEDVLFGYGEIAGQGLVLLFLRDNVGGVKRARAVVHSRSVASLFPDYSALITIAHPSQLTEELISERLSLNQSSSLPSAPKPKYSIPGSDLTNPLSPLNRDGPMPYLPTASSSRSVSASHGETIHQPSPKKYGDIASTSSTPSRQRYNDSPNRRDPRVISLNDTPNRSNTASPGPVLSAPIALGSPVKVENRGISSSDYFGDSTSPRSRKTSFGMRLKNTFTNTKPSPNQSIDESPSTPNSQPVEHNLTTSPKESRFKSNSLVKAFHRRRSSTQTTNTPPDSPQPNEFGSSSLATSNELTKGIQYAPPVPPKDLPIPTQPITEDDSIAEFDEPKLPLQSEVPTPSSTNTVGHGSTIPIPIDTRSNQLSPSPSARQALYDARQKSLTAETEIQERFRRDQEIRTRANENGNGHESLEEHANGHESDEESVRLAYDRSEDEEEHPVEDQHQFDNAVEDSGEAIQNELERETEITPTIRNTGQLQQAEKISQAAEEHAEREAALRVEEERIKHLAEAEKHAQEEKDRLEVERIEAEYKVEEGRKLEEERTRLERIRLQEEALREEERVRLEVEQQAQREAEDRARVEEERLKVEAEQARIEAEQQAERQRIEAEQQAERQRIEAERQAERQRIEAEQQAERERAEAEELARKQAEAAELARIKQLEEEELARRQAEEKAQMEKQAQEKQKAEEERVRKEGIKQGLERGKREGGIMLRGWVTVQTYKSMTWRRRYFHLLAKEMQLYKAEGDVKPIQTIYIGSSSSISEKYEESQVKDSFKVISDGPKGEEEFFLFTDSSEDKETVLQGLRLCMT
ncbi:uncharacterized protein I206_100681 [Kwoniella pini CBS 10737]|uniref:PH domain-containing protein n=1 Tax=Kwoniella pini CBS 10737 TaxID=1296096 RepID=A0A1B9ICK4_9TREE|nr:uncharacterized protein I206_00644 [Kwoniella pini CBS 10737]OCF53342.1 hypothetical protein I206_00644 [Kwoniella pini CBS 10737]